MLDGKISNKKINQVQLYQQISFSKRLNDISLWISKAKELLFAANHIKPVVVSKWGKVKIKKGKIVSISKDPDIQGVYFMLVAYAIENLCKAILVHQKQEKFRNRLLKKVPKDIKGHNLMNLAKNIGLRLSISDQELLARLSRNSIWAARYPIPFESDHMTVKDKILNGQEILSAYFSPEDINKIERFINRLKNLIKIELKMDI